MPYNSWLYLILFLIPVVLFYYLTPLKYRWGVLTAGSFVFFLFASRYLILGLLLCCAVCYSSALLVQKRNHEFQETKGTLEKEERKALKKSIAVLNYKVTTLAVVMILSMLFFAKYMNFAGSLAQSLLDVCHIGLQIPTFKMLMPLGISFYSLAAISYVVDVNRGVIEAERNFLRFFTYLCFFPVVTEGPICRYGTLGKQLQEPHAFSYETFCAGLQLMLWGLFQKVVVADRLYSAVSKIFGNPEFYSGYMIPIGILLYTLQIYADFAGCIDIARGSANLFGIQLEENFRQPFFSRTVTEFWRRWHMTLGSWLKDYVFYPVSLGKPFMNMSKLCRKHMNRYYASTIPALFALLAVWLGNGLWHGAQMKYVVYGLYYYAILVTGMLMEPLFGKLLGAFHINRESKGYHGFQMLRTFLFVNFGMLIFRADSLGEVVRILSCIAKPYQGNFFTPFDRSNGVGVYEVIFISLLALVLFSVDLLHERGLHLRERIAALTLPLRWAIYLSGIAFVLIFGAYGPGYGVIDFIYAQF